MIKDSLIKNHWNYSQKRFNQGVNDTASALDTNTWGTIFAMAVNRHDLADNAASYVNNFWVNGATMNFSSKSDSYNMTYRSSASLTGFKPYLTDGSYPNAPNVVWSEGTWGAINEMLRRGQDPSVFISSMTAMQDVDPLGGLVYANEGHAANPYEFHVWPSVAAAAWEYITIKDGLAIW